MILINLCGGPGAGKTLLSYYLAYRLKKAGLRAVLVGESAREEHIWDSAPGTVAPPLLDNQILMSAQQFERVLRLQRHEVEVAVSDSPLEQNLMYAKGHVYERGLREAIYRAAGLFETYNVFIHPRPGCYDPESRVQRTEAEARSYDKVARKTMRNKFWMEIGWEDEEKIGDAVVKLALSKRPGKAQPRRRRARASSGRRRGSSGS